MSGRNNALTSIAGKLRNQGWEYDTILTHLLSCPERYGLGEAEVAGIARSAMKWPAPANQLMSRPASFSDAIHELAFVRGWSADAMRTLGCIADGMEVFFPMRDADGCEVGQKRRRGNGQAYSNGKKSLSVRGCKNGLFFDSSKPLSEPVLLVEGEADTVAAMSAGWPSVIGTAGSGIGRQVLPWLQRMLAGKEVILAPDPDEAGGKWRDTAGTILTSAGCRVKFIPPLDCDLDKRIRLAKDRAQELAELINEALPWIRPKSAKSAGSETAERIAVDLGTDEMRVNSRVLAVLAERDRDLYQRAGQLVSVVCESQHQKEIERPADAPWIRQMPEAQLRERVSAVVDFTSDKRNRETGQMEKQSAHPPLWCVKALGARGAYQGIRPLEGIVESPILRPDGSLLDKPGYDDATGLLYVPNASVLPIVAMPTQADAQQAANRLLDIVQDFPFADDRHRSAWLACVLTPFARHAFQGPAPLGLIDANVRGCGKTILAELAGMIYSGRSLARMTYPRDEEELRKRITSLAMMGDPIVLIDNVVGDFGCASLDAVLTGDVWQDRLLGTNQSVRLPLRMCWLATGNNVSLIADTARRVLFIHLESPFERPEERSDFKHADLGFYVRRERARFVADVLTILRAYCVAGKPELVLKPWGSYEGWSALVRSAIVWAGFADPAATRIEMLESADRETEAIRTLLGNWDLVDPKNEGTTTSELMERIEGNPHKFGALRDAIHELCAKPNARSLGMKFHHLHNRVIGGRKLVRKGGRSGALWFVQLADCGTNGTSGTTSSHLYAYAGTRGESAGLENSPVSPASLTLPSALPTQMSQPNLGIALNISEQQNYAQ